MKILLTGGTSGGHFYPCMAVAESIRDIAKRDKLLEAKIYFMAQKVLEQQPIFENDIIFMQVPAGKVRRYKSMLNIVDGFKTALGVAVAFFKVFTIFPDVVFGKGGYDSFPALLAARIFGIPVVIHESDTSPGKVNKWAAKFAKRIAVGWPSAVTLFGQKDNVAYTGIPIRKEVLSPLSSSDGREILGFEANTPVIFIIGGSQGAQRINNTILDALPKLVEKYCVIHQTGKANFEEVRTTSEVILEQSSFKSRYKPIASYDVLTGRAASGCASLIISRAGSTSIHESACWQIPAILIPIPEEVSHDQSKNAFEYARSGGAIVIEEQNLSPNLLLNEIDGLLNNSDRLEKMKQAAISFARKDAANVIAQELINIALEHEK